MNIIAMGSNGSICLVFTPCSPTVRCSPAPWALVVTIKIEVHLPDQEAAVQRTTCNTVHCDSRYRAPPAPSA